MREMLNNVDDRIKFGTRLINPPNPIFSDSLLKTTLKGYDLESIYAFDNLILNVDRRPGKPNLLVGENDLFVIDHELTLSTIDKILSDFNNHNTWSHYFSNHVLYSYLQEKTPKAKKEGLDSFKYYLDSIVNLNDLDVLERQISDLGHPTDCYLTIKDYLCHIKKNSSKFTNLLIASIQ